MTPKYNITLAFVGNYCDFEHLQISGSTVSNYTISAELSLQQINSFAGYTYWPDIGSLAAIQEVNSSPNILPDFNIVVKRFSDCGSYWPTVLDDYSGASGGFATSVMFSDIADRNTDVLAVVGNEYSTTCRGPAEALSIQKIPYCSSSSGSPRLSDKNKYPYFWRTITARGIGEHMYQVLRIWNVKRIAVVYQKDDELGLYTALDIIESMQNHNILIVTQFGLRTNYNAKDIEYLMLMLKFVDARYIILSAQTEFSSSLLKTMQEYGMIGPQYVWFGFIPVFGSAAAKAGFILFQQSLPDMSSNIYHRFYETVSNIAEIEAAEFGSFNLQTYVAPQYDCAMMLLLGFDKLLKSYPAFTPAMLANRELQHFMNYTWFQNLNYNGLGASPMLLNQYGDFESSYDIFYYTGDNDNLTMFGKTNYDGSNLTLVSSPVFFDGSNIPPPDGPITISYVLVTISNSYALLFTILGSVGIGFSLFIFIFLIQYRKHHLVKSIGVDYTVVSLLGCILGYIHLLLETNPPSSLMCKIQILSLLLTYSFILIPLAVKNLYVWIIFTADEALDIDSLSKKLYGLTGALLFIEIILTAVWYSYSNASLKPFFTHTLEVYDCMYSHQTSIMTEAVQGALYVFNFGILIALISLASMVRNVLPTWNESALLLTIFFLYSLCGGFIYLLPMNTDEFNDLRRCLAVYATVTITLSILALPRVINVLCYNIFTLQNTQNLLKKLRSLEKTGNRLSAVIKTDKEILQHQIWGTSSRHNSRHSLNNQISGLHEAFTLRKTVAVVPIEEESNGSSVNTKQSETQKLLISRSLPGPVKYLYHTMSHRYLFRLKQTELVCMPWSIGIISIHGLLGRERCWMIVQAINQKPVSCLPVACGNIQLTTNQTQAGQHVSQINENKVKITQMSSKLGEIVKIKWNGAIKKPPSFFGSLNRLNKGYELHLEFQNSQQSQAFIAEFEELVKDLLC